MRAVSIATVEEDLRIATVSSGAQVIAAGPEHLDSLVECHIAALPQDFVPSLGREFVRRHDRFYIDEADGVVLVTVDEASGRVTGFVLGGSPEVRKRFVRQHAAFVAWAIAWRSLSDPRVRAHAWHLLADAVRPWAQRLGYVKPESDPVPEEPPGTWGTSIALGTHPDFRSDGAGRAIALLEGMHHACAELGFRVTRAMTPTTNLASHVLHTRLGWKVVATARGHYHYRREVLDGARA